MIVKKKCARGKIKELRLFFQPHAYLKNFNCSLESRKCKKAYFFDQSDSFLKSDFASRIVPPNIYAVKQTFWVFFPHFYSFFEILFNDCLSSLCSVDFEVKSLALNLCYVSI